MKLPSFSKYAPVPYPPAKPSLFTILRHINALGWVVSVLGLLGVALMFVAASRRLVSLSFALFLTAAFAFFWHRLIYLDAKYETHGEILDKYGNDFPDYP